MPSFPKRTDGTFWDNDEPIRDQHEALDLLAVDGSSTEPLHLTREMRDSAWVWELVVPWYHERNGSESSGNNYFQIDGEVAKHLVDQGLVVPRKRIGWGFTRTIDDEWVISEHGQKALQEFNRDMRIKAESMLISGVHTDLTGNAPRLRMEREHWRYGSLYFEFELPMGGTCRAYPEEDRLQLPEASAA
jgi:hypothetical protein